jgi:hypothetical protein
MTQKVHRELVRLRALAKTRRAAAWKAHRDRLTLRASTAKSEVNAAKG